MYADEIGWIGTILSIGFYLLLAMQKMRAAYVCGIFAAVLWTLIGILLELPSLIGKEVVVLIFLLWG